MYRLSYLPKAVAPDVPEANGREPAEQMASLRLWHRRLGAPTNGAVVLFGKDPLAFAPGAYAQYVRYDGTTQADPVLQEQRISGDLVTVLRELDSLRPASLLRVRCAGPTFPSRSSRRTPLSRSTNCSSTL